MGPGAGLAGRVPRRLRQGRGRGAGGVRDRGGALAREGGRGGGRDAGQPGCVAGDDGPQPGDRPDPPRAHPGREDPPAAGTGDRDGRVRRHRDQGRTARADIHLLPPGAAAGRAGGAYAAGPGRPGDRRDRPCVPGLRRDHEAPAVPCQGQDQGDRDPVRGSRRAPASRPPRRGAGRRVPDLQRGLQRPGRPRRRSDPAGAGARRAHAGRAGGPRAARADDDPPRPPAGPVLRRGSRAAGGSGPVAVGPRPDRGGTGGARPGGRAGRPRRLRRAGRDRLAADRRADRLAAGRRAVPEAGRAHRLPGGRAQPCRGPRPGRRPRRGAARRRPPRPGRLSVLPLDPRRAAAASRPRRRGPGGLPPRAAAGHHGPRAAVPHPAAGPAFRWSSPRRPALGLAPAPPPFPKPGLSPRRPLVRRLGESGKTGTKGIGQ